MTPDTLAKANSEHSHQRALFAWVNMAAHFGFAAAWDDRSYTERDYAARTYDAVEHPRIPALARLYAIPNGGFRDKITAGKLKAEGVKKGVPDLFLPVPMSTPGGGFYCGLYIELKRPQTTKAGVRKAAIVDQAAGTTSSEQDEWISYLRRAGYGVSVVFDWRSAAKEIQSYMEQ